MRGQEFTELDWRKRYVAVAAENGLSLRFYGEEKFAFEIKMQLAEAFRKAFRVEPLPFVNVIVMEDGLHCTNEYGEHAIFDSWEALNNANF